MKEAYHEWSDTHRIDWSQSADRKQIANKEKYERVFQVKVDWKMTKTECTVTTRSRYLLRRLPHVCAVQSELDRAAGRLRVETVAVQKRVLPVQRNA